LGEIKDTRAVEPLIAALKDNNSTVRWSAAEALGKIKDVRAIAPLIDAQEDDDNVVRREVIKALEDLDENQRW
jgi:HEAT repeat protein